MSDKAERKTERLTFRLTADEAERLRQLAARIGGTPSSLIHRAIRRLLSRAA